MLNNIGPLGLIVILVVVLLLFGRGKIPQLMGDVAKGIKSFKSGLADEGEEKSDPKVIDHDGEKPPATKSAPRAKTPRTRKSS